MIPIPFQEMNGVLGAHQEEYEPLPVHAHGDSQGRVTFCCRLSPVEIAEIAATGTIWIQQLTFGNRFQPIALSTLKPEGMRT